MKVMIARKGDSVLRIDYVEPVHHSGGWTGVGGGVCSIGDGSAVELCWYSVSLDTESDLFQTTFFAETILAVSILIFLEVHKPSKIILPLNTLVSKCKTKNNNIENTIIATPTTKYNSPA